MNARPAARPTARRAALGLLALVAAGLAGPAAAQIAVRSDLAADRDAVPGETYGDVVLVENESDQPREVKVYQTDYAFSADGTNRFDAPGTSPRSNAPWVTFGARVLTLAPREVRPFPYTVAVPAGEGGAAPSGTYWSMLMVEEIPPGSAESTLGGAEAPPPGLQQVTRYGVQLATHVGAAARPALDFADVRLVDREGRPTLEVDVVNGGDRLARTTAWVDLFDAEGRALGRRDGTPFRIYPGTSVRQRIPLDGLAPGRYEALVAVDAGGDDVYGGQFTLDL